MPWFRGVTHALKEWMEVRFTGFCFLRGTADERGAYGMG